MANPRIEIMGPLGSGKTTLANAFAESGSDVCFEKVDQNPYLAHFYGNPSGFAFEKDMFFIIDFMHQAKTSSADKVTVFDYSMWGNLAYIEAGPQISETKKTCRNVAQTAIAQIGPPVLTIYLDCPPETLAQRVLARSRSIEEAVPLSYLQKLQHEMDSQIQDVAKTGRILIINSEQNDLRDPIVSQEWVRKSLALV